MNTLLSLLLVSLCGMSHALHLPVVARSPVPRQMMKGKQPVQMMQMHLTENVENAHDVVVSTLACF